MMPRRTGKAALCLALFISLGARAQESKVTASISPNPVPESESAQLQIEVEAALSEHVTGPAFSAPDFTIMGAPGMTFTPVAGPQGPNTRKKQAFTYVLMPKRAGDFQVSEIKVKVGTETRMAPNLRVKVTAGPVGATPPPNPFSRPPAPDEATNPAAPGYRGTQVPQGSARTGPASHPARFNSDFTVHAVVNKQKAYVGEPIVAEYFLYDFGHVRQVDVLKWPTFDGFWREDLHLITQPNFEEIFLQNQEMRRAFIARYALYGIKPGKLPLDKLRIRGKYVSDDMLSPGIVLGFDMRTGEHASQDVDVEILPLPEAGRPANYSGAVGEFALKLESNRQSMPQNSPLTLTLTLSGVGNFQAIDAIKVPLPDGFEMYDSVAQGRITPPIGSRQELDSKKTFQVTAIPRQAGKFEIPAVSWSFFNPEKATYETITTEPLAIEVTESSSGTAENTNTYLGPGAVKGPPQPGDDWRAWKTVEGVPSTGGLLPWLTLLALLINLVLAFVRLRDKWRGIFHLMKGVDRFSEARIAMLQAKGIRDSEWQAGLEEVLLMTMQVLLETNPRGLTKQDLEEAWKSRNLPAPLYQRINALLDEIDRHRFSSQKLAGTGSKELRSRLTRETESLLAEASRIKRK